MKIWRALQKSGALAIKNSVYALPNRGECVETITKLAREIREGGGEAVVMHGSIVEGFDAEQAAREYNSAINQEYRKFSAELKTIDRDLSSRKARSPEKLMELSHTLGRLESQINALSRRNHYAAEGETIARSVLGKTAAKLNDSSKNNALTPGLRPLKKGFSGKTWVTRAGLQVDRLASAWLIEREIDKKARFRFVDMSRYRHEPGDLRFDVFGGEFTHEGELCTFEVLLEKFEITDRRLRVLGQIIHDLDIEDGKYQHPATDGVKKLLQGIVLLEKDDLKRKEKASALFEQLLVAL